MLKHTLWISGTAFSYTNKDIGLYSNISYVIGGGTVIDLTIIFVEWGELYRSIIFYTNNPFDLTKYTSSTMKMFSTRLL